MTAAVSKAGPYYTTPGSEIKFSDLRRDFRSQNRKQTSSGSETFSADVTTIKASELLRNTTNTNTNPIVPDCTENRTTVSVSPEQGISTSINWKFSQFRGSIKYYYITQSGTDINFDIDAQSWNNNLNKNIRKFLFVDGTCGSNDATLPAAQLNATTYNMTVDVYGNIIGASGRGGGTGSGAPAISGQKGGDALEMTSSSGANNIVLVRTGSKIYAGGGGGEKGRTGVSGSSGSCYYSQTFGSGCQEQSLPGCESLLGGSYQTNQWQNCCREDRGCAANNWYRTCRIDTTTSAGSGGTGGNGGPGRGYNWQEPNSLNGSPGSAGSGAGSCPSGYTTSAYATNGPNGESGASGGEWASSGGNIDNQSTATYLSNFGNTGGAPGKAIFGSNYSVDGTISSDTVKGSYT